jgi:hypothetical protein
MPRAAELHLIDALVTSRAAARRTLLDAACRCCALCASDVHVACRVAKLLGQPHAKPYQPAEAALGVAILSVRAQACNFPEDQLLGAALSVRYIQKHSNQRSAEEWRVPSSEQQALAWAVVSPERSDPGAVNDCSARPQGWGLRNKSACTVHALH